MLPLFPDTFPVRLPEILAILLVVLGSIGVFFDWVAFLGGRKLLHSAREKAAGKEPHWPFVLMVKPVKGLDEGAKENFLSFIHQDYPDYQILFVVGDGDDPVVSLLRQLQEDFPQKVRYKVILEHSGTNRKMNNVSRAVEGEKADLVLINDSDIRVHPSYMKTIVAPILRDPSVGMVTCLQRGTPAGAWSSRLASLMLNTEAIPQALVAYRMFPIDFAFGPTMLLRREALEKAGGFSALTQVLADDYHLGQRIVRAGYRIHLSSYLVDAHIGEESLSALWNHELRWARTYRNCRPVGYAFSILTRPFVFLLSGGLLAVLSGFGRWGLVAFFLYVLHFGFLVTISERIVKRPLGFPDLLLFPAREVLSLCLYAGSFGSRIVWRGHNYRIQRDGTLLSLDVSPCSYEMPSGGESP